MTKTIFTSKNILKAYFNCRRNKRKTINALRFEIDLEENLANLLKRLKSHTYSPSRSICFIVTSPKSREIFAADFSDRIVHHLLINEIEEIFEKRFIYNSYACRKEKGTHKAVYRLHKFVRKSTHNTTKNAYFLQLDIKSFFPTLDKAVLLKILKHTINNTSKQEHWKSETLWLAEKLIFHDPTQNYHLKSPIKLIKQVPAEKSLFSGSPGKGLPIGNLTSQFFANVYLNELDQFVKRKLKIKYYIRYVDDLVLLSNNPDELFRARVKIDRFLRKKLKLELHPQKDVSGSVYSGIDFLGYIVFPNHILCRRRVVSNFKSKLHLFNHKLDSSPFGDKKFRRQICSSINSYYGHFRHANCFRLRTRIYNNSFGKIQKILTPINGCKKVVLKTRFKD